MAILDFPLRTDVSNLNYDLDDDPDMTLLQQSLRLAHTPIVARNVFPEDATCELFGVPRRRDRSRDVGN